MSVTSEPGVLNERYEVGDVIGRGGMGEVRQAFDRRLARPVAIKFLRPDLAAQPAVRQRFEAEARNAARLTNPHVVLVLDTGEHEGQPYLVMECLPGRTLHDELAEGPVEPTRVRAIARDVLSGLTAAHEMGVLHRDVTPSNILLTEDGTAKIADFGIAKSTDGLDQTMVGQILGTPAYMSPERLMGEPASPAADLYALGVVLYEALTGEKTFRGDTPMAVAQSVVSSTPVPLRERMPDLDAGLITAIDGAMEKKPTDRWESAAAMTAVINHDARPLTTQDFVPLDVEATTLIAALPADPTVAGAMPELAVASVPARGVRVRRAPATFGDRVLGLTSNAWLTIGGVLAVGALLIALSMHHGGTPASATEPTTTLAPPTTVRVAATVPLSVRTAVHTSVAPKPAKGHGKHD